MGCTPLPSAQRPPPAANRALPQPDWTSLDGEADADHRPAGPEDAIHRLVLWNVDLTLVDVARVTRAAYAEAFPAITGRPLIKLPQTAGRSESEIFFDALALNGADVSAGGTAEGLLEPF